MQMIDDKGYEFGLSVVEDSDVVTQPGECVVRVVVNSPRTAFVSAPYAVERIEVMAFLMHLTAMVEGLVEVANPDSEDGWVEFPALYLRIRQVLDLDGDIAVELSFHDCGCADDRPFNHGAFLTMEMPPEMWTHLIDEVDAEVTGSPAGQGSPA